MNEDILKEILNNHAQYYATGGTEGSLADISGGDLKGMDLQGVILDRAYLAEVNLDGANLDGASLVGADLSGASLRGAILAHTFLDGADLRDASLDYQIQEGLGAKVAKVALKTKSRESYPCGTTLGLASFATVLNDVACRLDDSVGAEIAALLTLGREWHELFFKSDDEVREFLIKYLEGVE